MGEPAVRRLLAAMVMADVVGYSRLVESDEAATVARLRQYRTSCIEPVVRLFRGRVVNAVGDSMFFEFASVVDATQCAIALQQALAERNAPLPEDRRLLFRMGVNIGDVIARDRALFGDSVNIAARLEGLAEPGGICLSGAAFDQVRRQIEDDVTPLGRCTVKNIARTIEVFSLSAQAIAKIKSPVPTARRPVPIRRFAVAAGIAALACVSATAGLYVWTYASKIAFRDRLDAVLARSQAKLTSRSRAVLIDHYLASHAHRALAVAPQVQDHWWGGDWSSPALAEEKILERCQIRFGEPCALAALDDDVMMSGGGEPTGVRDMPRLHYAGDFDPAQIPAVRTIVAQRADVAAYAQGPQPKAAAIHPRGILSIVTAAKSQRLAEIQALRRCNDQSTREGGGDCFLYAVGNRIVLPMRASSAMSDR